MKKLITLAMLCMVTIGASAQKKHAPPTKKKSDVIDTSKFTGIGIFKLGSDTSIIHSWATKNNISIYSQSASVTFSSMVIDLQSKGTLNMDVPIFITDVTQSSKMHYNEMIARYHCPEVKEFHITQYIVSGIKFTNVRLTYYLGRLVSFECERTDDIEEAMTEKYGKPMFKRIPLEKSSCLYKLTGITRSLQSDSFEETWSNGPIEAQSYLRTRYDDHCEKKFYSGFYYEMVNNKLNTCENNYQARTKASKKDLSDL